MALIRNPILFSEYFDINAAILHSEGLVDTFLNVDTPLFIDPLLIPKSSNNEISGAAFEHFKKYFSNYCATFDDFKSKD